MQTRRRSLELREHSTLRAVWLDSEDVEALRASPARLDVRARADGRFDVHAKQIVGTVRTRQVDLVIRPKIELDGFLELLGHAPWLARLRGRSDLGTWDDFLPALAELYAHALKTALRRGILLGYESRREALSYCRGRVDSLSLGARRFGVIPPIDCEFEEFSPDIELNQRLRAAARFLVRSGLGSRTATAELRAALDQFASVSDRRFHPPLRPLPVDRRLGLYGPAVDLANLVLSSASLDLRSGAARSVGFLLDMDHLYEAWVARMLREELGASKDIRQPPAHRHPPKLHLDFDRTVKLEPDVLWSPEGRPSVPIDAKYKRGTRLGNPDVYQMAAYCAGLGVRRGVVFCVDVDPGHLRLRNGVEIWVRRLSVEGGPAARKAAVQREARFLAGLEGTHSSGEAPGSLY